MTSIPIVFLYDRRYYKADIKKIPGTPVEYHLFQVIPSYYIIAPQVFVSDPKEDTLIYDVSDSNHCVAAAIIDSCKLLEEPVHV